MPNSDDIVIITAPSKIANSEAERYFVRRVEGFLYSDLYDNKLNTTANKIFTTGIEKTKIKPTMGATRAATHIIA